MIEELTTKRRRHERISLVQLAEEAELRTVPVHRMDNAVPHRTSLDDRNQLLMYRLSSAGVDHTDAMRFNKQNWLCIHDGDGD